jgi:hypothetical protein
MERKVAITYNKVYKTLKRFYIPCYKYVLFLFYLIKKINYEKRKKRRIG